MKKRYQISILLMSMLFLTQLSVAESNSTAEQVEAKSLVVEAGATKIGEEKKSEPKTRGIRVGYADDKLKPDANMNVGKIEFYVK
jgi:hypothetical protein